MDNNNSGMMPAQGKTCKCPHHSMIPLLVTLFGVLFLLNAFGCVPGNWTNIIWPILVIVAGVMKLCKGMCKCC